jgi:MraZ protein
MWKNSAILKRGCKVGKSVILCENKPSFFQPIENDRFPRRVRIDPGPKRSLSPSGRLKKQLPEGENTRFVINRGFEKCLSLYPKQSWEPLFAKISTLNDFDPKVREFRRYFLNGATEVELDSAGRLLLPPALKEYAGLGKDIVLASAVDKIEIWSKDGYQKFFESYSSADFSSLAQQVMGGSNNGGL